MELSYFGGEYAVIPAQIDREIGLWALVDVALLKGGARVATKPLVHARCLLAPKRLTVGASVNQPLHISMPLDSITNVKVACNKVPF